MYIHSDIILLKKSIDEFRFKACLCSTKGFLDYFFTVLGCFYIITIITNHKLSLTIPSYMLILIFKPEVCRWKEEKVLIIIYNKHYKLYICWHNDITCCCTEVFENIFKDVHYNEGLTSHGIPVGLTLRICIRLVA